MIFTELEEFCDATAVSVATTTDDVILGDVMDLGSAPTLKGIGVGTDIYWVLQVDTAIAIAGAATVTFKLCSDSTANLATSKTTHAQTPALNSATAVAGYTYVCPLPANFDFERYLGTWQTNATATITAGKINSFLTTEPSRWTALPAGI